jgi:thioredoxin 1
MKITGLEGSTSPLARMLTVVRFANPLDLAAQKRAREMLRSVNAIDLGEPGDDSGLEPESVFVAGTANAVAPDAVGRVREVVSSLEKELGATEASFLTIATTVDIDAYIASESDDEDDEDEEEDGPTSFWKAGPPPGDEKPSFPVERYPLILEAYDWEDFGIALKLGGAPVPGERTLLDAFHTFWLQPYIDLPGLEKHGDDAPAPWRHTAHTWDAAHRAGLFWVDRFAAPASADELVHHLLWVVARLNEIVPIAYARFDSATMQMKYAGMQENPPPPFVLAGNPLLMRFEAEGESAAMTWAESQRLWDRTEVAAMFVEVGKTHDPDEPGPAEIALRLFDRAIALDPTNDDAAGCAMTALVRSGKASTALTRLREGDDALAAHVLGEIYGHATRELRNAKALIRESVLANLRGDAVGELITAAALHAPDVFDAVLAAVPNDPEIVAYVFNTFATTDDTEQRLKICLRALDMPLPEGGPHRTAWLTAMNNANIFAHALKNYDLAVALSERGKPYAKENPFIPHASACAYAALGRMDEAFEQVKLAVELDYEHLDRVEIDTDLGALVEEPRFKALFEARRALLEKSEAVLHTTDETFESAVLKHDMPVLVDFTASWCGPCKRLAPIVAKVAASSGGRYRVAKLDVDESPEMSQRFEVTSMPTLIVFRGGKAVARHVGLTDASRLRALLAEGGVDFSVH